MKKNISTKKVQILLSTYNGEKHLREQLDSFVNLTGFENIKVLIRDDGSTDGTIEIIEEYCQKFDFQLIKGENIGVNKSLFKLFEHCNLECDYFAISDQDDVWIKDKILIATKLLAKFDNNMPLLFASRSCVTDDLLNPLGFTNRAVREPSFYNAMTQNIAPGHTQLFNKALIRELIGNNNDHILVIDWWIYLLASALGKVVLTDQFTVYHRQHGKNTVGYETNYFKATLNRFKRLFSSGSKGLTLQLSEFHSIYSKKMPAQYRDEVIKFLKYRSNFFSRLHYVVLGRAYRQNLFETLIFKFLYLIGRY